MSFPIKFVFSPSVEATQNRTGSQKAKKLFEKAGEKCARLVKIFKGLLR
jgi:hypothetical protein